MVSALDVYQQKQVVERVKAEIPLVEAREELFIHELALLLGKPPLTSIDIHRETLPIPFEIPPTGLPADLLASRPDIRSAGMQLRAADWQVAAAQANRLPAISLSAEASFDAVNLDKIFNNWILSLAGNLVAPIFDGNRRAAEVDRTRAVVDENLSNYRLTVLTAIKEVEDALVGEETQRQHIKALEVQILLTIPHQKCAENAHENNPAGSGSNRATDDSKDSGVGHGNCRTCPRNGFKVQSIR
jgi:outer membrane protein TolC